MLTSTILDPIDIDDLELTFSNNPEDNVVYGTLGTIQYVKKYVDDTNPRDYGCRQFYNIIKNSKMTRSRDHKLYIDIAEHSFSLDAQMRHVLTEVHDYDIILPAMDDKCVPVNFQTYSSIMNSITSETKLVCTYCDRTTRIYSTIKCHNGNKICYKCVTFLNNLYVTGAMCGPSYLVRKCIPNFIDRAFNIIKVNAIIKLECSQMAIMNILYCFSKNNIIKDITIIIIRHLFAVLLLASEPMNN